MVGCAWARVWVRVCTPARPPRLHHDQRRLACTPRASLPLACPRMRSVVRGAVGATAATTFPTCLLRVANQKYRWDYKKGLVPSGPSQPTPRGCHPREQVAAARHPRASGRPPRPLAPVLCAGNCCCAVVPARVTGQATACLAGHGGVTLRSASRQPACTHASGACRLSCRAPRARRRRCVALGRASVAR